MAGSKDNAQKGNPNPTPQGQGQGNNPPTPPIGPPPDINGPPPVQGPKTPSVHDIERIKRGGAKKRNHKTIKEALKQFDSDYAKSTRKLHSYPKPSNRPVTKSSIRKDKDTPLNKQERKPKEKKPHPQHPPHPTHPSHGGPHDDGEYGHGGNPHDYDMEHGYDPEA